MGDTYTHFGNRQDARHTLNGTAQTNTARGLAAAGAVGYVLDPSGLVMARVTSTGEHYYVHDHQGSTMLAVDEAGNIDAEYRYNPWGDTRISTGSPASSQPFRYLGGLGYETDPSGLLKAGTRYYQPEVGRWTQPDPSGQEVNTYLYSRGNPVDNVDPSGRWTVSACIGGAGGGGLGLLGDGCVNVDGSGGFSVTETGGSGCCVFGGTIGFSASATSANTVQELNGSASELVGGGTVAGGSIIDGGSYGGVSGSLGPSTPVYAGGLGTETETYYQADL